MRRLAEVALPAELEAALENAARTSLGSPAWRARKRAEARELLALSALAPRLSVEALDLTGDLLAAIRMHVPVPCLPDRDGELVVAHEAHLALRYAQDALKKPLAGYEFVQIHAPRHVWHANVAADPIQPLCLGDRLPRGIPVREIVLAAYGALSMQTVQIDERDGAGVMNAAAARWWQHNTHRIPLSSVPFLGREDLS